MISDYTGGMSVNTSTNNSSELQALIAEQAEVQKDKFQGRGLAEYNRLIFPGETWSVRSSSAVADAIRPLCTNDTASIENLLLGMRERNSTALVWVDMGGGCGVALREFAAQHEKVDIDAINVDLIDYGLDCLTPEKLKIIEKNAPGSTASEQAPTLLIDSAETVQLSKQANLITSVEGIQYLGDPLSAIANWYNQLAPEGIMIISTEHEWSDWINYSYDAGPDDHEQQPTQHFLAELAAKNVQHAATKDVDSSTAVRPELNPQYFKTLVIQKLANTRMSVEVQKIRDWVNPWDFKQVFYENPPKGIGAPLHIVSLK